MDDTDLFRHRYLRCYDGLGQGANMKFICVLSGIATGFWSRRRTIIAAMAAMALLPIEVSDAGRLSHIVKSSSNHGKSPKHLTSPKPRTVKLAALRGSP
jgi:hypothetical protein